MDTFYLPHGQRPKAAGQRVRRAPATILSALALLGTLAAPLARAQPAQSRLFADGFEAGTFSAWTITTGLVVQREEVGSGLYAARATSAGTPAYAQRSLGAELFAVYARVRFDLLRHVTRVSLLKLRSASKPVLSVGVDAAGRLYTYDPATGAYRTSAVRVTGGDWHEVEAYGLVGQGGQATIWLDGVAIPDLSGPTDLGTSSVDAIVIGNPASGRTFDVAFDDAAADDAFIVGGYGTDVQAPAPPLALYATSFAAGEVDLAWSASSDNVKIRGYTLYRDGEPLANVRGDRTTYADTSVRPATSYVYAVEAFDAAGNRSARSTTVQVLTPRGDPIVAAAGDIACDPKSKAYNDGQGTADACRMAATAALLPGADAVLPLGDEQYQRGRLGDFQTSYGPAWGQFLSITHPVPGGQEYARGSANGYYTYFGFSAGDPTKGYYSFNLGTWHVIALNSQCRSVACGPHSAQYKWLKGDLGLYTNTCTLAYWHDPRFSSGKEHGDNPQVASLWSLLANNGADVVLGAHDNDYERFAPMDASGHASRKGIREFVVGTGGRSLSRFSTTIQPNSQARTSRTFGVLVLTLHSDTYDWSFRPVAGGTFTDAGTGKCH